MVASADVTRPSKPRVGGSNPSGRADFPSEIEGARGRSRSLQVGSGPHPVPAAAPAKLNAGAGGEVDLALRALETLRTHLRQARWLHRLPAGALASWQAALDQANELGAELRELAGKAGA